jgi:hypothetical protein
LRITTSRQRSFRRNRKGLSNIIVVVLSLVVLSVIVVNVVLWDYQMNQADWERTQEEFTVNSVSRVTRSSWFVTQTEFQVTEGNRVSGSYLDTQIADGSYERFRESPPPRGFDANGTFSIDTSSFPLAYVDGMEILLRYAVDDVGERWFLKAFNWTSGAYSDSGFNSTNGHAPGSGWNSYAVNLTNMWHSYVSPEGRIIIKIRDQQPDSTRTNIDIDYLAVRAIVNGAIFTFQNQGSRTAHLVSIWVNNATAHMCYETDLFVNSGETYSYTRLDIRLLDGEYIAKVISERGNTAVHIGN